MESPSKSCANCHSQKKTKLCHCGSIYICDIDCWKSYCETNPDFKTKCQIAKHRLQIKALQGQQKSAAGKKRKTPRDGKTGRFANLPATAGSKNNNSPEEKNNTKEKTPEQRLKDQIASKASDKKKVALKFLRGYCKLVPENKLFLKEVKKKGKAEIWLQSPGYNPLQSRLPSANPVTAVNSGVPVDDHENSAQHGDSNEDADNENADGPPNIENIPQEAIIQERKKINLKQFCGICTQGIGSITKRLKCNKANCQTHSSVHMTCVGLYPTSDTDRKIIQKSYFCPDHRPEADSVPDINQEEPEGGVQSTEGGVQSTSSKVKTSRKRKASKDPVSDLSTPVAPKRKSAATPKRKSAVTPKTKSAATSKQVSKPKPGVPDGYSTPHSEMSSYSPSVNTPQISEVAKSILPMLPEYSPYPTATESSSDGFVTLTNPSTSWSVNGVNSINGYQINENELNESTSFSSSTLGGSSLLHFTSY